MKRAFVLVLLAGLLIVSLASAALAAQTGSVERGDGNCQVLANGGVPGDNANGQGHDRGLHRAHQRAAKVFGTTGCS